MKKHLPKIIVGVVVILVIVIGAMIWQKSQVNTAPKTSSGQNSVTIKKVDLASQPQWVQSLQVTAKKGVSANGLANVTLKIDGLPKDLVQNISLVLQYQTSNKGTQGALSSLTVNGATTISKTIDLGTCSTKTCVRHEGVTSVDVELDFTTSTGEQPVWTNTISLQ